MKAIQISQHGSADVLQIVDLPKPQPVAGEILIKVAASGINYADVLQRAGLYPMPITFPHVLGYEVAGTVEAVGEGVTNLQVGQRVAASLQAGGGYAEYAVVPAAVAVPLPDFLSDAQGTAILVQGLTATGLLHTGNYESVLVLAAAGGVGSILVQLAKAQGKTVIAAVGQQSKKAAVEALGADLAVSYSDENWSQTVLDFTEGNGVSAVFDSVGGTVGEAALQTLGQSGKAVVFGGAGGAPTTLAAQDLIFKGQSVQGYTLYSEAHKFGDYLGELFGYIGSGKLQLAVQSYAFADVQQAHRDIESRKTQGKVVLVHEK